MAKNFINGAVLEVGVLGHIYGQNTMTVLHYMVSGVLQPKDWNLFRNDFHQQFYTDLDSFVKNYLEATSDDFFLDGIRYQLIFPTRYAYDYYPTPGDQGGVVQPALPPNDGATITKRNDATGKNNRGSIHMPGVPSTFVVDGFLTAAAIGTYAQIGAKGVTPISLAQLPDPPMEWAPVIFHRVAPGASQPWTTWTVQDTSRVNRRRTVGVGE